MLDLFQFWNVIVFPMVFFDKKNHRLNLQRSISSAWLKICWTEVNPPKKEVKKTNHPFVEAKQNSCFGAFECYIFRISANFGGSFGWFSNEKRLCNKQRCEFNSTPPVASSVRRLVSGEPADWSKARVPGVIKSTKQPLPFPICQRFKPFSCPHCLFLQPQQRHSAPPAGASHKSPLSGRPLWFTE